MSAHSIIEWITDANTCFLIGAGCSKCAGKPLINKLTDLVRADLETEWKEVLDNLNGVNTRSATIEDLLNFLVQLRHVSVSSRTNKMHNWTPSQIDEQVKTIQKLIVKHIGTKWESSEVHKDFIRRLTSPKNAIVRDIFSLNYDTLIEASLEELQLTYIDGFRGFENAFFDSVIYDELYKNRSVFRIYKLHGSINWTRNSDGVVRRQPIRGTDFQAALVYPAEQKYVQTQYGIYETLLFRFRQRLREDRMNNKLIVLGYSFNDEHINVAIEDSIRAENSQLTVYAFLGPEDDVARQIERIKRIAEKCDDRFNAFIGGQDAIGNALEPDEWNKLRDKGLWQFEKLVELVVKGKL